MRILIAGPPRTGNVWTKHILASLYGLKMLDVVPGSVAELEEFVKQKRFRDRSIFHQHFRPTAQLFAALEPISPFFVTTNRNPYDTFVSLYSFAQRHPQAFTDEGHGVRLIVNKPIDHPDVLAFLGDPFRDQLSLADAWIRSGRSIIVRYEDLYENPYVTIERLANQIKPVSEARIRKAVDVCSADVLKKRGGYWNVHIGRATVGDWQTTLTEQHLKVMRERHADLIKSTGYEVS